ncbi:hypothetical protein AVEN_179289-1 [Araneus ventricosus]|uniref:Uncharacterized protein n=1 Tax=Araneus ventricosus TaxID=182803 RepID=A0A4Y2L835_ARAVE|nr:hypothetical protein AVEN_179289-1 [Araneus ventricosus]
MSGISTVQAPSLLIRRKECISYVIIPSGDCRKTSIPLFTVRSGVTLTFTMSGLVISPLVTFEIFNQFTAMTTDMYKVFVIFLFEVNGNEVVKKRFASMRFSCMVE